ncbi:glycoside hydrolase superfamily [Vararia minispora EC-137]|uniref:Glycoside hydrolase superfamily n=1 Tax=Vararia minispora EC-137 TaxID=1314806 RepID=A0ACB8QS40_9AGAM|nr:glycoside hydrolase superfamily [Vararia minispora EC-137]
MSMMGWFSDALARVRNPIKALQSCCSQHHYRIQNDASVSSFVVSRRKRQNADSTSVSVVSSSTSLASVSSTVVTTSSVATNTSSLAVSVSATGSFVPIPTPSSGPAIPGVFPATSPKTPPPVESPGLVPDFADAWASAYKKATAKASLIVASLTLEEKVNISSGTTERCIGNTGTARGFPGLCLEDSPLGVRLVDFATVFPAGINAAATFKRSLIRARGLAMGQEHVGKGVNVALGPMMNLGRVAEGGRNWEGFGADPYLAGEAAYETILGMQQAGVQACAKHFIDNEQETNRMTESSDVDDRTQHEVYALPFLRSVMAGTASVMCSYNKLNGTYACEDAHSLTRILKTELGFRGFVVSDWGATHSTAQAANAGLDVEMPDSRFFGQTLVAAVEAGAVPEARIDDMATRVLAAWYFLGQDSPAYPPVSFDARDPLNEELNAHVDVQADHDALVREIGKASVVLLKNARGALPLKRPRSIVVIGERVPCRATVARADDGGGSDAAPARVAGPNEFANGGGVDGILAMGGGSGTANFTYLISPYEALQRRARQDRTSFFWFFDDANPRGAAVAGRGKSAALVFLQSWSREGADRPNITALHAGDALVQAVASTNPNTIVVVHSVGPLVVEPWIEHPNVTAVLWAGLSGPETGNALADVVYGDYNPSGRLPYTIARALANYPAQVSTSLDIPYSEGLNVDYRHFDATGIEPRFEFGFGLSYTSFAYGALSIRDVRPLAPENDRQLEESWAAGVRGPMGPGSSTALWLHRAAVEVSFEVTNTGSVHGTEIAQLYVRHAPSSGEPPSVLKGFADVALAPGRSKRVSIGLSRFDLSVWDAVSQTWVRPAGTIGVAIGASSRDFRLNGTLDI